MRVRTAGSPCGAVAPSTTVAVQVDVTAGSFRRCRASDEISLRLRRTRQSDLRSNICAPRKSDHAAGMLADIMVDALNGEASRETSPSQRQSKRPGALRCRRETGVSPDADHTPRWTSRRRPPPRGLCCAFARPKQQQPTPIGPGDWCRVIGRVWPPHRVPRPGDFVKANGAPRWP